MEFSVQKKQFLVNSLYQVLIHEKLEIKLKNFIAGCLLNLLTIDTDGKLQFQIYN